ncbi:MAG: selenium cofactor biosynthesis protein YqeC [Intestinibacter bartlettii]|uniref:selenium cofactor biosynthesis protein YqeC n=1 Tax=Intestinibacter bartlettii TaxID=261299 RepID=UPI0026F09D00|nr:selenium cofactor biosynthesis protein YqeC [Intestinibacter bartlettii]MDO5010437.1 selenium cofactor biosynthesis protein YqeC [Intestinibacter bartlettii]
MKIYSYKKGSIIEEKNLIDALDIDLKKDKIITLVGAGGKTSTIFELGKELLGLNKKTIITTTTHMGFDKDFILVEEESDIKRIENILNKNNLIKVAKKESEYKVKSLGFDLLKKIIALGNFILIEGDGSKNLPLKVPKDNEPVIIKKTNLVIGIMGFDSINKKIKDICHRQELVSKLLKKDLDEIIDYKDLVKIAQHENGLKKNVNCKYKVIINKVDKEENLELCKNIANLCERCNIDVIFTSYR